MYLSHSNSSWRRVGASSVLHMLRAGCAVYANIRPVYLQVCHMLYAQQLCIYAMHVLRSVVAWKMQGRCVLQDVCCDHTIDLQTLVALQRSYNAQINYYCVIY